MSEAAVVPAPFNRAGDAAVITGRSRTVRDGQEQPGQVRYIHVYTRRSGAWQMVAMQVTRIAPAP